MLESIPRLNADTSVAALAPNERRSILYLGALAGSSYDRAQALRRLGHHVDQVDLRRLLPSTPWVDRITWRLGGRWFGTRIRRLLESTLSDQKYDVCFVDGGEWVTPSVMTLLHRHASRVVNYNLDDPLGRRDGARFQAYRDSVPSYDLCVVVRSPNLAEARHLGARNVMRVYRCADEIVHAPRHLTEQDRAHWGSEVLFLGTWFPERGPFLLQLAQRGIPLTIRGSHWHKAPEWPQLSAYCKGGELIGDDYAKAIQCAQVTLGLLSKGNRDLHTQRSSEIPSLGGLLCAERTSEHESMYVEGEEALFWSDVDECAAQCQYALSNASIRDAIAAAGRRRLRVNGHYNEPVMRQVLEAALSGAVVSARQPGLVRPGPPAEAGSVSVTE